jgi:pimeloyl-ACP methyl ester carboxylesterase
LPAGSDKTFLYQQISDLNPPHQWLDPEQVSIQQLINTKIPIFMLAGEEDVFFMPPMIMDMYKERLPQAEFLTIPGTGHSPYFEKSEVFNTAVMRFISQEVFNTAVMRFISQIEAQA